MTVDLALMITFRRRTVSIESLKLSIVFVHNLIAKDTIDEWVDTLLNAKYQAAQLAQGDISCEKFDAEFTYDLSESLAQILSPVSHAKS